MQLFRTLLIISHRYLGIVLSLMFVVWFVSAFFMIYTGGMPRITPDMQIDGMQPVDFSRVRISPEQAVNQAGYSAPEASLRTILDRPVYEIGASGFNPVFVAADNGEVLAPLSQEEGRQLASAFLGVPAELFTYTATLNDPDQWTLSSRSHMPLYKYEVADGLGTQVYVSPDNALVSVYTTRQSRALAWLGTIPHWLYFTSLRNDQPLWYNIVVYLSYGGCILSVLGLALGFTQLRKVRPFVLNKAIPYKGLMRWHYILGSLFGVVTLTWVFSGLVSMEPWVWTNASGVRVSRDVYQDEELALESFAAPQNFDWNTLVGADIKQVEFSRVLGTPVMLASYSIPADRSSSKRDRLHQPYNINGQSSAQSVVLNTLDGKLQQSFSPEALVSALDAAIPSASVSAYALLDDYDDYYYSRQGQLPLPVLRVIFDDPAASWIYVDPQRGQLLSLIHKYSRVERWLYSGLHSLDFAFWYHKRPLWDIGVILLLSGGLLCSLLGLYFSLRRVRSDIGMLLLKLKTRKLQMGAKHVAP